MSPSETKTTSPSPQQQQEEEQEIPSENSSSLKINEMEERKDSAVNIHLVGKSGSTGEELEPIMETQSQENYLSNVEKVFNAPLFVPKAQIPSLTSSLKDENSPPDSPVDSKTKMYPPADSSAHPNHSRSLPTSRRNSGDYTNLWNAMDSLSFNPRFSADARKTEPEDETKPNTPFEGKSASNFASDTSLNDLQNCSSREVLANTIADSNKKDSVIKEVDKSPSAPPQFSDSFMLEDDGASTAGVVSTASNNQYNQTFLQMHNDGTNFPSLLRKDLFPGLLSARSAALDLASLPQMSPKSPSHQTRMNEWNHYGEEFGSQNNYEDRYIQLTPPDFSTDSSSSTQQKPQRQPAPPAYNSYVNNSVSNNINSRGNNDMYNANNYLNNSVRNNRSNTDMYNNNFRQQYNSSPYSSSPYPQSYQQSPSPTLTANTFVSTDLPGLGIQGIGGTPTGNICRYYQQGYCSRGERCNFQHVPNIAHVNPAVLAARNQTPQPQYGNLGMMNAAAAAAAYFNNQQQQSPMMGGYASPTPYSGGSGNPLIHPSHPNYAALQNAQFMFGKQQTKKNSAEEANRFSGIPFQELVGQLFTLCKDQHGCRYLQKKLEENDEKQVNAIFLEVFPHFGELMIDPFGNYLCQRLLEFCSDEQRTLIAESISNELISISLNMHGTRAVQKMIEYLSNAQQIRTLINALAMNVVTLIKDLNGNHVIQKCLNKLSAEQNQFIYNAVTKHCIEVATHRHGCCVLQRCIDFSIESQKIQLVSEITYNALTLVQDPFGNYVVQYVLDLAEGIFADAVIRRFIGNVCILSVQKFSSNVIEKCIRVAMPETRIYLVEEMLNKEKLDKLLKDSYANYVVQTALDFADPVQRIKLVDCIRPLLVSIRNTPHGKRIYNKIHREQYSVQNPSQINLNNLLFQGGGAYNNNSDTPSINGGFDGSYQHGFSTQGANNFGNGIYM